MKITELSIQKKDKSRINVILDGEYRGVLFDEIVYSNRLKSGDEISEEFFSELVEDSNKKFARNDVFRYLSRCFKTEQEVKDYLYRKGYHKSVVEYALSEAKNYKLIDDAKYVADYYQLYCDSKSVAVIKNALKTKGIKDNIIDEIIIYDEDKELELARKLVEKLAKTDKNISYKDLMRLKRQLLSRGISYQNIDKVTTQFNVIYDNQEE